MNRILFRLILSIINNNSLTLRLLSTLFPTKLSKLIGFSVAQGNSYYKYGIHTQSLILPILYIPYNPITSLKVA